MKTLGPERTLELVTDEWEPDPIMYVEPYLSAITGAVCHQLVLEYKEHKFEEPLPADFMTMDEASRNLATLPIAERLRQKLRPILLAEDGEAPSQIIVEAP
jgi:hypothetical protein